jgi:hypothetical protein
VPENFYHEGHEEHEEENEKRTRNIDKLIK